MMSVIRPTLGVARPTPSAPRHSAGRSLLRDVRQHQILLVGDADLAEGILLGQIGDGVHLLGGGVARRPADRLQRDGDDGIARPLVGATSWRAQRANAASVARARRSSAGRRHSASKAGGAKWPRCARPRLRASFSAPSRISAHSASTLPGELLGADLVDQDLDARLVDVVAPAVLVVDAQDRLQIGRAGRAFGRKSRIVLPIIGVRPSPPPTSTSKPISPSSLRTRRRPMSWTVMAARSCVRRGDRDLELARQEA